jgi:hypothetical protein
MSTDILRTYPSGMIIGNTSPIPLIYQYPSGMWPEVIPGLYLPYTGPKSALGLIRVPNWYNLFLIKYPLIVPSGYEKRERKTPYQDTLDSWPPCKGFVSSVYHYTMFICLVNQGKEVLFLFFHVHYVKNLAKFNKKKKKKKSNLH